MKKQPKKKFAAAAAAALACMMLFSGCGWINKKAALVTIENGDETDEISLGYGNFLARYNQALYDQMYRSMYGDTMWDTDLTGSGNTMEEDVKDDVLKQIETQYVSAKHASDYGVSLSDDDKSAIKKAAKQFMSDNSEEALDQMGATESLVEQMLRWETYSYRVEQAIRAQADTTVTDEESVQSTFSYVLFSTASTDTDDDGNAVTLTDDQIAALKQQAQTVADAADFDAAAEAAGAEVQTYSYTASEDANEDSTFDPAVINAANVLSDGQTSGVIEVDGEGFYVLRMDQKRDEDATATKVTELQEEKEDDYYNSVIEGWEDDITWTVHDRQWKKVKFDSLFENAVTENASSQTSDSSEE